MPLLPPRVVGSLSPRSSRIKIEGELTGATVDIFVDNVRGGGGVATLGSTNFPLDSGVTLTLGAIVTATKTHRFGGAEFMTKE
jgi:hypothetical protein